MPDESLSHPGERLPNWLTRSLSQAFTPRASLQTVAPRHSSELSDEEEFDFNSAAAATSTSSTTTATATAASATAATRRANGGGLHDAFKPSPNNAIALTAAAASAAGAGGQWGNAGSSSNAKHQAPLHQSGLDLAFHVAQSLQSSGLA